MEFGIGGKVAMVAAGSAGIGLAAARLLAAEGARVSICGRNPDRLQQAVAEIGSGAIGTLADVSQEADLTRWYDATQSQLGPPAGAWPGLTDQQWQSGFDSTLLNIVRMVRLASPPMVERGWGRIVHVTSLVAREPSPMLPISSTLRAGVAALTRLQNTELAPHGVTVNAVLPGHTLTDRQRHLADLRAEQEGITADEALARQGSARDAGGDCVGNCLPLLPPGRLHRWGQPAGGWWSNAGSRLDVRLVSKRLDPLFEVRVPPRNRLGGIEVVAKVTGGFPPLHPLLNCTQEDNHALTFLAHSRLRVRPRDNASLPRKFVRPRSDFVHHTLAGLLIARLAEGG
ncbi:MAG: hypothetical protein C4320_09140 [Armatimonadota bacterium]